MNMEQDRWRLALEAHAAEHESMREKGLSRGHIQGRPYGMKGVQLRDLGKPYCFVHGQHGRTVPRDTMSSNPAVISRRPSRSESCR